MSDDIQKLRSALGKIYDMEITLNNMDSRGQPHLANAMRSMQDAKVSIKYHIGTVELDTYDYENAYNPTGDPEFMACLPHNRIGAIKLLMEKSGLSLEAAITWTEDIIAEGNDDE